MHNDCWYALPAGAIRVEDKYIDGLKLKAYQITHPESGETVIVVQKGKNRFETIDHTATDPHFNRLSQQIDAQTGRYLSTGKAVDGLYNRSYLRSETLKKIFDGYTKLPNGDYYHALSNTTIKGPIDIGHAYGWEHRRLSLAAKELNMTQAQFNDYVNARPENFRLENMSRNRGHYDEMPGKGDIKKIKDDMKLFLKTGR